MGPNTHSAQPPRRRRDELATLAAAVDALAAQDLDRQPDPVEADRVLACGGWPTAWKANSSSGSRP